MLEGVNVSAPYLQCSSKHSSTPSQGHHQSCHSCLQGGRKERSGGWWEWEKKATEKKEGRKGAGSLPATQRLRLERKVVSSVKFPNLERVPFREQLCKLD